MKKMKKKKKRCKKNYTQDPVFSRVDVIFTKKDTTEIPRTVQVPYGATLGSRGPSP
jgi:hypothetical protein